MAAVLAAATLFAANGSVSKLVLEAGLSPLRLVEIRCVAAAVVFTVLAVALDRGSMAIGRREMAFVAVYGVTGIALVQWLYFVAIERMPVGIALLIEFTAPLLVALYVRFVRREPVRRRLWIALALAMGGLVLVAQAWKGATLDAVGVLGAACAALALAAYYLLSEHGLGRRGPLSLSAWTFCAAGVFWSVLLPWWSFPAGLLDDSVHVGWPVAETSAPLWLLVAWVVLLGTVAPFGLVLAGVHRIGATRVSLLGTAEPALAGAMAWVVLGEVLTPVQVLGAAVVLAAIVLAETARTPHPHPP